MHLTNVMYEIPYVLTFVRVNVYYVVQYVLPSQPVFLNVLCIDMRVLS
jgi:hypothetical protein